MQKKLSKMLKLLMNVKFFCTKRGCLSKKVFESFVSVKIALLITKFYAYDMKSSHSDVLLLFRKLNKKVCSSNDEHFNYAFVVGENLKI